MLPEEISPLQADQLRKNGDGRVVFLDCREQDEVNTACIDECLHVPMGDIASRLQTLDPDKEYVVVCHHGMRGMQVARFLKEQDFPSVKNMRGGIDAWSREVDPKMPRY